MTRRMKFQKKTTKYVVQHWSMADKRFPQGTFVLVSVLIASKQNAFWVQ